MSRFLVAVLAATAIALPAVPAPKPKDAPAPADGPITVEQLHQSANNLKQIGLGIHNYSDTNGGTMPTNQLSKDKKPLLSWRVQILQYMDHDALHGQFKLDEPWDSEHNKRLIDKMPALYAPVRGKADKGMTFYQAIGGPKGWLKPGANLPAAFLDGTSNTFLVVEAARPVIWTRPDDLEFDGTTVPHLGGMFDGKFHALFGDGSVRRFRKDAPADALKVLIDPADGTVPPEDIGLDKDEKK